MLLLDILKTRCSQEFQTNLKKAISIDPQETGLIGIYERCVATNGTPAVDTTHKS